MATHLVHWLESPIPADSRAQARPIAICCSVQCVAAWALARKIQPEEVRQLEVETKPRGVCSHCNHCGQRLHLARDGYCNLHGRAGCPRAVFEVTTAAQVFAWHYAKKTRRPVSDEAWTQARRLWELGYVDGPILAMTVWQVLKTA